MKLSDIYYQYWSLTGKWSWESRAFFNSFVAAFLIYIVLKLTYRKWRPFTLNMHMLFLRVWFLLWRGLYYDMRFKSARGTAYTRLCETYNSFSQKLDSREHRIRDLKDGIKKKSYRLRWFFFLYAMTAAVILGPVFFELDDKGPWTLVLEKYREIEEDGLAKAVFESKKKGNVSQVSKAETKQEEKEQTIKYCLNEEGRNGSNLRQGPGKNSEVVTVLEGDVVMEQMETQEYKGTIWVHVKVEDGTEGWISQKLLEVLAE